MKKIFRLLSIKTNWKSKTLKSLRTAEIVSSQSQDTQSADKYIISVPAKADDSKRLAKQDVMFTWAVTRSLSVAVKHT